MFTLGKMVSQPVSSLARASLCQGAPSRSVLPCTSSCCMVPCSEGLYVSSSCRLPYLHAQLQSPESLFLYWSPCKVPDLWEYGGNKGILCSPVLLVPLPQRLPLAPCALQPATLDQRLLASAEILLASAPPPPEPASAPWGQLGRQSFHVLRAAAPAVITHRCSRAEAGLWGGLEK